METIHIEKYTKQVTFPSMNITTTTAKSEMQSKFSLRLCWNDRNAVYTGGSSNTSAISARTFVWNCNLLEMGSFLASSATLTNHVGDDTFLQKKTNI